MSASSVMIELEPSLLAKLDDFVEGRLFRSRSDAVAVAVREKIERLESHAQFLAECQKFDPAEEQAIAEEWLDGERTVWAATSGVQFCWPTGALRQQWWRSGNEVTTR